ncbi:hypothetical protein JXA80_13340, partial [bacterium]|nr:hypothetical protein [candidate division CSSED10-310 bacterium]
MAISGLPSPTSRLTIRMHPLGSSPSTRSFLQSSHMLTILIATALITVALATVHPLPFHIHDALPTIAAYSTNPADNDPAMFCWNLWWTAGWMDGKHPLLTCSYLHHPFGISLARHTLSPANGILAWPVTRTLGCIPAHNILVILHALFTTCTAFLLARKLGIPHGSALLTATIFTWWPARNIHAAFHLNLASTGWLCLSLSLMLMATGIRRHHRGWIFAAALAVAATGASSWYLLLNLVLLTPIILSAAIPVFRGETDRDDEPAEQAARSHGPNLDLAAPAAALILGLILLLPLIIPLLTPDPDIPARSREEKETYSIPLLNHAVPPVNSRVFHHRVKSFYRNRSGNAIETTGYLGLGVLALALTAGRRSRSARRLLAGAAVCVIVSWGPTAHFGDNAVPLPYRWLDMLPGLEIGRTPGRFMIPAGLLLALAAGYGLHRLWMKNRPLAAVLCGLVLTELLPAPMDLIPLSRTGLPSARRILAHNRVPTGGILMVPNDWTDRETLLLQTVHGQPITTGFAARLPDSVFQRIDGIPGLKQLSSITSSAKDAAAIPDVSGDTWARLATALDIRSIWIGGISPRIVPIDTLAVPSVPVA